MNELDFLELVLNKIETELGYSSSTEMTLSDANIDNQVVVEDWNSSRDIRTNTPFFKMVYEDENERNKVIGEEFQFYYDIEIDLVSYSEDEVKSMEIKNEINNLFNKFERNPRELHEDIVIFEVGNGGKKQRMFEPTSMRFHPTIQTLNAKYSDKKIIEDDEVLEEVLYELNID